MPFVRTRSAALAPRRTGGALVSRSKLDKVKERSRALAKRARDAASEDSDALAALGTAVGLTMLEKRGTLPKQIAGFDSQLVLGVTGYILTRKAKGKTMGIVRQASLAAATVGAARSTERGSVRVSGGGGEDDEDPGDEDI